jgi:hypothetical protein
MKAPQRVCVNSRLLLICIGATCLWAAPTRADVLEPYDNMPGEPGNGAVMLYPTTWDYPTFHDDAVGDLDIDAAIFGAAIRAGVFLPKIANRYSWAALVSLPYLQLEAAGEDMQTGFGDPGLALALWPLSAPEQNLWLSLWLTTYFPWGNYDKLNPVTSPGTDVYTFAPGVELGWYPGQFLFDALLQYWYFTESDTLNETTSPFLELDLLFSCTIRDRWIASLQTNIKWDTDDLEVNGDPAPGTRGYVYGLGPKLSYMLNDNTMLSLTWLHDVEASNALEGDWVYGRIAWGF